MISIGRTGLAVCLAVVSLAGCKKGAAVVKEGSAVKMHYTLKVEGKGAPGFAQ